MKPLSDILCNVEILRVHGDTDLKISGLEFDSRKVKPRSIFFAVKGGTSDGHNFIELAIEKGAIAVVCEQLPTSLHPEICYIEVRKTNIALGIMASNYFGNPSGNLALVGVTGTNGKTTTVTLLYRLFMELGFGVGLISTIINKINNNEIPASHTTPDPLQLNELLAKMVEAGCSYCFMEVSSHAIDQERIAGLTYRGGVFSNITHDHLDYHKTFEAYLKVKKRFFDFLPNNSFALVNKDDKNGMVMLQNTQAKKYTYSVKSMADFHCKILENQIHGLQLNFDGVEVFCKLIGIFNAYNLLSVYGTAMILGMDKTTVLTILSHMEPVEGRFNYVLSGDGITAIVDYAHTPDALQNVLETINTIREHHEQLITVVGAGGNRDATKRPVMAQIACNLSDRVILTSDNPRFEEPEVILSEMQQGVEKHQERKVLTIVNRLEAIKTACALAKSGDIVLVAGKGHETYQEIKGVKHHFDDKDILHQIFEHSDHINP
ncbi:MAG: UDP-N-acetylmuramoyl-L-alanyl-D-glutamate--2,6-diaminopimelate ligase [Bacteroidales bacterium]|nr:UDP-N-acetylmuramoyl-L-alanyl-D-glutamate--2,6-diaminopimelate ligase [Bacteroidales bacterium]